MRKLISAKLLVLGFLVSSVLSVAGLAAAGLPYSPLANFGNTDDPYAPYERPRVWIEADAPDQAIPGEHIYVDVWSIAMDGAEPVGWQYDLDFDPNILTFLEAEPLLSSIIAQTPLSEPCISAYQDHGDHVSTSIVCEYPAPHYEIPLARYWFEVETHLPVGMFGRVDVRNTFVGSYDHPPREIESQGHSDGFVIAVGVCGDQNDDGLVNILDAIVGMQVIVGSTDPTARQLVLGDLDDDGDITVVDVIILLRYLVGWVDHLDCGVPPFATQCPLPQPFQGLGPRVTALDWRMHPNNNLIFDFNVDLSETGAVWTEYWPADGSAGPLRTALSGPAQSHDYQVMRLRADTTYCFWVSATHGTLNVGAASLNSPPITDMVAGSFHTGRLPEDLAGLTLNQVSGHQTYPLTLVGNNDASYSGFVMVDDQAEIVWYYQHDDITLAVGQKDDFNLVFGENHGEEMYEIAPDGTVLNRVGDVLEGETCSPAGRWHHEMMVLPGNRVLTLGSDVRPIAFPNETIAAMRQFQVADEGLGEFVVGATGAGSTIRNQTGDTVELWDIDAGTVTRIFNQFDVLDPVVDRTDKSDVNAGFFWHGCNDEILSEDWTHSNSISPTLDGNILISIRHLNQVIKVDLDSGSIIWRLGGPRSNFTFPDPADQFYHQHTARETPDGNITVFDNGNFRPDEEGGAYSRGLELRLDMTTMTAEKVWEYRHTPDEYSACCSSVSRLPNDNTVIIFGAQFNIDTCCRVFELVEADPLGNAVSVIEISSPGKATQYRVLPLESINGETRLSP